MLKRLHGGSDAASARKAADPLRPRVHASNTWEVRPLAMPHPMSEVSLTIEYKFHGGVVRLLAGVASPLLHGEIQEMTEEALRRLHSIFAR